MAPPRRPEVGQSGATRAILVAVHRGHLEVEKALDRLSRAHMAQRLVSVVGADYHTQENVYGYYSTGRRFAAWGSFGAFWSDVWARLIGDGVFFIPGIGPLLMAGPLVGWLEETLETGAMVHGLSPLGTALVSRGVPANDMLQFEVALRHGEFLLIVSAPLAVTTEAGTLVERIASRVSLYPL